MRERENLFNDFMDELRRKEKDDKHQKKEQVSKVNTKAQLLSIISFDFLILYEKLDHIW